MINGTGRIDTFIQQIFMLDKETIYDVSIKKHRNKRSLDANGYCWVLCKKIADVIGSTKEDVYRASIKQVGSFEVIPVKNEAVDKFMSAWQSKGIGWVSEVLSESKINGYTNIIAYYGSSTYDSREMSILIDNLVYQAKELNIDVMTAEEIANLKSLWRTEC